MRNIFWEKDIAWDFSITEQLLQMRASALKEQPNWEELDEALVKRGFILSPSLPIPTFHLLLVK